MTKTNGTAQGRRFGLLAGAALAGTALGLAAIYVIETQDGNGGDAVACAAALETAQAIKPLATGEMAAFLPATRPLKVSHLAFRNDADAPATLADYSGKTVLLNLWATWCAPCRKEMPALDRLQGTLGGDNFEVVAVNVDTKDPARPKGFLEEIGVEHLAFHADNTMDIFTKMRSFGRATGLPSTMLVDAKGCEIGSMYGPAEWDSPEALALLRAAGARPE